MTVKGEALLRWVLTNRVGKPVALIGQFLLGLERYDLNATPDSLTVKLNFHLDLTDLARLVLDEFLALSRAGFGLAKEYAPPSIHALEGS